MRFASPAAWTLLGRFEALGPQILGAKEVRSSILHGSIQALHRGPARPPELLEVQPAELAY